MADVEKKYVINGTPVDQVATFAGITVYRNSGDAEEEVGLYFAKNGKVVQSLYVSAECGQNMGYISELTFTDVK